MNSPYSPPNSEVGSGPQTDHGKMAKGSLAAGLITFAAAIIFIPKLVRLRPLSVEWGVSLDPLIERLTIGGGIVPATILGSAGIFAIVSFLKRRRWMMLTSIVVCFLLSAATVVSIPQLCFSTLRKMIRDVDARYAR